jgi:hypothetical protein
LSQAAAAAPPKAKYSVNDKTTVARRLRNVHTNKIANLMAHKEMIATACLEYSQDYHHLHLLRCYLMILMFFERVNYHQKTPTFNDFETKSSILKFMHTAPVFGSRYFEPTENKVTKKTDSSLTLIQFNPSPDMFGLIQQSVLPFSRDHLTEYINLNLVREIAMPIVKQSVEAFASDNFGDTDQQKKAIREEKNNRFAPLGLVKTGNNEDDWTIH